ncbi:Aspartate aminotransferase [Corynebacterium ciconiae DSM 44920]|uniref:pyridoxal phosphate-dependent aminotransferase n=1 Tax=Corynebacterium ciconiae TaxID=227319 RepID=UPI00036D2920|nr:aminotransferase class I/II-fold pyridoxal phosphate-dependent enzyme [Corynebacterium ciconiae]WKD60294.1 Aspartate aminotransferase [Corynebacterium ciconiae DSM 44920]
MSPSALHRPAQRIADQRASSLRPPLGAVPDGAVSLALGEPDFPTPAAIAEAGISAVHNGNTRYTDQHGLCEVRQAILEDLPRTPITSEWNAADNIVLTHGATAGLGALFFALISPGDKVVIPQPAYSLYADQVTLAGGEVVFAEFGPDLHFDRAELERVLPGARMIIFSNPSNPTGIVHRREELDMLAELTAGTDTLVVADEAYSSLTYTEQPFSSALEVAELRERLLYVQTFSKKYCMTGWRLGYVAGPAAAISAIGQFHRTFNGSISHATQLAGAAAMRLPEAELEPIHRAFASRRNLVAQELDSIEGVTLFPPEGAFYAFFRYGAPLPSAQVAEELAERGVIVRAGAEYGPSGESHIRISFAASEEDLRRGLGIIRDYFGGIRKDPSKRMVSPLR